MPAKKYLEAVAVVGSAECGLSVLFLARSSYPPSHCTTRKSLYSSAWRSEGPPQRFPVAATGGTVVLIAAADLTVTVAGVTVKRGTGVSMKGTLFRIAQLGTGTGSLRATPLHGGGDRGNFVPQPRRRKEAFRPRAGCDRERRFRPARQAAIHYPPGSAISL